MMPWCSGWAAFLCLPKLILGPLIWFWSGLLDSLVVLWFSLSVDLMISPHLMLLKSLRRLCPSVRFLRLGGPKPVSEELKRKALTASDLAISLVDNAQETFGLAVAEAMAAGLPLVASDWSGYRDLVRDGVDGFLIPSVWSASAQSGFQFLWDGSSSLGFRVFQPSLVRWPN